MDLNGLAYHRLASNTELTALLATYDGGPAIFNSEFPNDQQSGWGGSEQYPRIDYRFNLQVNPERSSSGYLSVSVYTENNQLLSDQIETLVRRSLKDVIMKPSDGAPFCVSWARSDGFLLNGIAILARDITFDILEYPDQQSTDPDPIMALSTYIKDIIPDAVVIGVDRIGDYTDPADAPVFYCHLENIALDITGYSQAEITWFNTQISVHLLCPDASMRLKLITGLSQRIASDGEIIMLDDSPMTISGLTVNNRSDYLRDGQMVVNGHYGALKDAFKDPGLRKITLSDNW